MHISEIRDSQPRYFLFYNRERLVRLRYFFLHSASPGPWCEATSLGHNPHSLPAEASWRRRANLRAPDLSIEICYSR